MILFGLCKSDLYVKPLAIFRNGQALFFLNSLFKVKLKKVKFLLRFVVERAQCRSQTVPFRLSNLVGRYS